MPTKGFPELQQLYSLVGAPENVALWPMPQFPHHYNLPTREHIYAWFNKHFALGIPEPIVERDYKLLPREQLTVWDAEHPAPKESGLEFEKKLLRWWDEDSRKQIAAKPESLKEAWRGLIGRGYEPEAKFTREELPPGRLAGYSLSVPAIRDTARGEAVPFIQLASASPQKRIVVWLNDRGAPAVIFANKPIDALRPLLDAGTQVAAINLFGQGSAKPEDRAIPAQPLVKNPREALAYSLGYNDALLAQRVHDVVAFIGQTRRSADGEMKIVLVGNGRTAPIATAAAALAGEAVDGLALEAADEHPFAKITDWRDPNLLPGAVKYGDLEALIKLIAPRPVILFKNDAERAAAIEKLVGAAK